jgi:HEAT repeat protein
MRVSGLATVLWAGLAIELVAAQARPQALLKPAASDARRSPPLAAAAAAPVSADVVKRLKSGDDAQTKSALDDVRVSGRAGAAAVSTIVDLLERGLSPDLTRAAIDTLGDTESEAATVALTWYARHRNVALRRAAVQALSRTRGAAAIKALRLDLSDPDAEVRGLSATGLGAMKAKDAIGDLFVALDHRVSEASGAIGQICVNSECEKLAAKLGSVPLSVVTTGLDHALLRTMPDVSDDTKVKIVGRVRELGTAEANRFLREVQTKSKKNGSPRVRLAIDQAVLATSGSPGGEGASSPPAPPSGQDVGPRSQ